MNNYFLTWAYSAIVKNVTHHCISILTDTSEIMMQGSFNFNLLKYDNGDQL